MTQDPSSELDASKLTDEELLFISKHRTIDDFTIGLQVPGKLTPKHIPGGILLTPTIYTMRKDARLI